MSPEHDPKPQPSAVDSAAAESSAELPHFAAPEPSADAPSSMTASAAPAAAASSIASAMGAATGVARAQEAPPANREPNLNSSEVSAGSTASAEANVPSAESSSAAAAPAATSPEAAEAAGTVESHETAPAATEAAQAGEPAETGETMDQLLDQFSTPPPVASEGEIFDGRVLAITDAGVVVDVGGKFEGLVPAQEFLESGGAITFGEGQTIEVERLHEQKDGYVLLSHIRAHRRRVWERIEKAYREHTNVTGKATERIKGGLVVDIGVRAFLPASQIELRPVHDLDAWKDREFEVRVLKLNRKRGNVVVSRRAILEDEQKSKRESLVSTLAEGTVVTGRVKNITDYGVFVDLGGIDGLLHVSDLVWGRVPHPSSIVKAGDEIQVQVLKFDKDKRRIRNRGPFCVYP